MGIPFSRVSQKHGFHNQPTFSVKNHLISQNLDCEGAWNPKISHPKKHGVFPHAFLRRGSTQRSKDDVFSRCAGQSLGFLVDEMGRRTIWTKMF